VLRCFWLQAADRRPEHIGLGVMAPESKLLSKDAPFDPKLRPCRCAIRPHAILNRDAAAKVFAQGRVNDCVLAGHVATHYGQILFFDQPAFPETPQLAGRFILLGQEDNTAGFAIQAIHQVRTGIFAQIQAGPADQTGVLAGFGRMADQAGGLVDHQQLIVFVDESFV